MNAVTILNQAGYNEPTVDTKTSAHLAHIVYLVTEADGKTVSVYQLSTRSVPHNLSKYLKWIESGSIKHLPMPVQRRLDFKNTGYPQNYVRAFMKFGKFMGDEVITKLRKAGHSQLGAKERTTGPFVNIYKLSIKGDDRFKLVVSKMPANVVVSQFVSKSKDQAFASYETVAMAYRGWCIYNHHNMDSKNIKVETLATDLLPGAGKMFAKLYLDKAPSALILNSKW